MTHQLSKLPEDKVQRLLFYSENDLDNRSAKLLFWNDEYKTRAELLLEVEEEKQYSDYTKSWMDLLLEKKTLNENQKTLFVGLISKAKDEGVLNAEVFRKAINDSATRRRLVELATEELDFAFILEADLK